MKLNQDEKTNKNVNLHDSLDQRLNWLWLIRFATNTISLY